MTKAPAPPRRGRRLSDDEIALWRDVAARVVRRAESVLPEPAHVISALIERPVAPPPPILPPRPPVPVRSPPLEALDRRLKQKLSRGRVIADAAIDLHGLRQAEAHVALRHFLHGAQRRGASVVMVVTGKGGRTETSWEPGGETGVLRRVVPLWLSQPDLRPLVVGFDEAARHHGGSGALYVRLRRRRGNGED